MEPRPPLWPTHIITPMEYTSAALVMLPRARICGHV